MKIARFSSVDRLPAIVGALVVASALLPSIALAQNKKKNPTSKVYISDVQGEGQIDIGEQGIQDLTKKSVYNAQGTIIETKKAEKEEDKAKVFSTMVYSNGTGAYFDQDTKVEVKRFLQEPFTPNRVDMDTEPSISQTQAFVARGTVGLCNSKQVAGSNMIYSTAQGSVNIRGKKVVIEAGDGGQTKISMIEGDGTVRAGSADMGGQTLHTGEQAIIRPGIGGAPGSIQIQKIPRNEAPALEDKVASACMAKKTVYFEVKEKQSLDTGGPAGQNSPTEDGAGGDGTVTAFDNTTNNNTSSVSTGEIVAVPTQPAELPRTAVSESTVSQPQSARPGGT